MNCFCSAMNTTIVGIATSSAPAASRLLFVKNWPWRLLSADVIGRRSPLFISIRAQKKSL